MRTNTSMTHYHKEIVNHEEQWTRNVIDDVMWQETIIVNPTTGFSENSQVKIYIPYLVANISKEDVVVKGIVDDSTPNHINNKYTITSVINCDYGSDFMQHTELVAK